MLKWARSWFGDRPAEDGGSDEKQPSIPDGHRVYAIGDVHGRFDLLFGLVSDIRTDSEARGEADVTIVLLGDLIDRGPHSREVVQFAMNWRQGWTKLKALKGNHEAKLIGLLDGRNVRLNSWLMMGGKETLTSYGIPAHDVDTAHTGAIIERARDKIPMAHQRWLRSLPSRWACGDYLFVHAGLRPGVQLEAQSERDLLGIRGEFLESTADHGPVVVHGHSVNPAVDRRPNRIGIDTGAWRTGNLTAVGLEAADSWFLTHQGQPLAA